MTSNFKIISSVHEKDLLIATDHTVVNIFKLLVKRISLIFRADTIAPKNNCLKGLIEPILVSIFTVCALFIERWNKFGHKNVGMQIAFLILQVTSV